MKEFLETMKRDILEEGFTRREMVVFGVVAPLALVGACLLPGAVAELLLRLAGLE